MINIPSTIEDDSYRYTMPMMELKYEGKNTGIHTNIVNLPIIAKKLRVPTEFIIR